MSPSKSVVGKISRVTFNKSLINIIRSNIWISTSKKSQFQLLLNYLIAFSKVIDDDTIFIRAAFFESIFEVFEDVIQTSIAKNGNAKIESITEILNPLKSIEWQDQAKGTKSTYLNLIRNSLKKNIEISDSMV